MDRELFMYLGVLSVELVWPIWGHFELDSWRRWWRGGLGRRIRRRWTEMVKMVIEGYIGRLNLREIWDPEWYDGFFPKCMAEAMRENNRAPWVKSVTWTENCLWWCWCGNLPKRLETSTLRDSAEAKISVKRSLMTRKEAIRSRFCFIHRMSDTLRSHSSHEVEKKLKLRNLKSESLLIISCPQSGFYPDVEWRMDNRQWILVRIVLR